MQPVENQDRKKTENKDIGVEPSRGQPTINPWYSETKWKIGQEKKKKGNSTNSSASPAPKKPIRKYQLSEIPQQQNPHNVLPTRPYTEIFAHVAPKKIENTNVVKQTPPPSCRKVVLYVDILFFFW
jgi:hypothetical protein